MKREMPLVRVFVPLDDVETDPSLQRILTNVSKTRRPAVALVGLLKNDPDRLTIDVVST